MSDMLQQKILIFYADSREASPRSPEFALYRCRARCRAHAPHRTLGFAVRRRSRASIDARTPQLMKSRNDSSVSIASPLTLNF